MQIYIQDYKGSSPELSNVGIITNEFKFGFEGQMVYLTRRKTEHFFRIFEGFGMSVSVYNKCVANKVQKVIIVFESKYSETILASELSQWKRAETWNNELQNSEINPQYVLKRDDMNFIYAQKMKGGVMMEKQTENSEWLVKEDESLKSAAPSTFEQLPSLKLVPNVITELDIDFSKPFGKWPDEVNNTIKAIIPVSVNGTKMNFWLNIKNPLYAELIHAGREGTKHFKILQTGTQKNTRYTIVK